MLTSSTLSPVRESSSTAPSTSPRVSHALGLSKRSSPPLSVVSVKAIPLSTQCRSCSSTLWERETTLPRRPATYFCSCPCLKHHVTLSSSALMDLVLLRITWRRGSVLQHSLSSTMERPDSPHFNCMTLLEFARQYSMPKTVGAEPTHRSRRIVVIPLPYVSSDPAGEKYEQYCRQSLMQHKSFRLLDNLLSGYDNYIDAYAAFLQSGQIPSCLEDDLYRLLQSNEEDSEDSQVSLCACPSFMKHMYTCYIFIF